MRKVDDWSTINAVIAIISAVIGGGVVKVLEVMMIAKNNSTALAADLRQEIQNLNHELKADAIILEKRIEELQHERDSWRDKYYNLVERGLSDRGAKGSLEEL